MKNALLPRGRIETVFWASGLLQYDRTRALAANSSHQNCKSQEAYCMLASTSLNRSISAIMVEALSLE